MTVKIVLVFFCFIVFVFTLASIFSSFAQLIKDCLFPIFCFGCGREGVWVCDGCFNTIPRDGVFCCPLCHVSTGWGESCHTCQATSVLARVFALGSYDEQAILGRMICALKYEYVEELLPIFSRLIQSFFAQHPSLVQPYDMVVPVPLHPRRQAERGFNQAAVLGKVVGNICEIPLASPLERVRYTERQAQLPKRERVTNVREAFDLSSGALIMGKRILLVDDVYTTGSTMQECARVLREAGAGEVAGFVVARG